MNLHRLIRTFFFTAALGAGLFSVFIVDATPPSDDYTLAFSDEFDGTALNEDIWQYRIEEKLGGMSRKENVRVENGQLVIDFKKENINGTNIYTAGGIISKQCFGYGYYETKCKLFDKTAGVHSAFWIYGLNGDGINTPLRNSILEIDGFEVDSHEPNLPYYSIVYYIGNKWSESSGKKDLGFSVGAREVVFGFEWLPDKVVWYVDGQVVHTDDNIGYYAPQNVWLTALANTHYSSAIDDAKLPGTCSWDYFRYYTRDFEGVNLLGASGFEFNVNKHFRTGYGEDPQYPLGWIETGDADAQFVVETNTAFSGDSVLRHYSNTDYKVGAKQNLTYIQNGTYNLSVMLRSSGGQKSIKLKASGFDGDNVAEVSFHTHTTGEKWEKLTIENIQINDGRCTVELISDASAFQWLDIDEISLISAEKTGNKDDVFIREYKDPLPADGINAVYLDTEGAGGKMSFYPGITAGNPNDGWDWSGVAGSGHSPSVYSYNDDAYIIWKPDIPGNGKYRIYWYAVCVPQSTNAAQIEINHSGGVSIKTVDLNKASSESDWVDLGEYYCDTSKPFYVKLTQGGSGILRAADVRFVSQSVVALKNSIIFAVNKHIVYVNDVKKKIAPSDMGIVPVLKNNVVLVPLAGISQLPDTTAQWDEQNKKATISSGEDVLVFTAGQKAFLLNGNSEPLSEPMQIIGTEAYLPINALAEATGKKVSWGAYSQSVAISDKKIPFTPELDAYLKQTFDLQK